MAIEKNGNNSGDTLLSRAVGSLINTWWAPAVCLITFAFWLSARLEDPADRLKRIEMMTTPINARVNKLEEWKELHEAKAGHAIVEHRITVVESRLTNLEKSKHESLK